MDGEEIKVAEHKDLEDEDQTIYVDELYRADFEILKVNADNTQEPLSGVTFHITSHRVKRDGVSEDYDLGEFTTDENGKIFIEKLKEDTVLTITETKLCFGNGKNGILLELFNEDLSVFIRGEFSQIIIF